MGQAAFPFPVLLADIGGTNARFVLLEQAGAAPKPMIRLSTHDFPEFCDAARAAMRQGGWPQPASLLVGAAGPVIQRRVRLTNAGWTIDGTAIRAELGLQEGILCNDFEAVALCLPALVAADVEVIGAHVPAASGMRLVIGPGTGLGVGAMAEVGGRFLPVPSEGGHIGFAAETPEDRQLWHALGVNLPRMQAEVMLAAPALPRIYRAKRRLEGRPAPEEMTPAVVVDRALNQSDPDALATIHLWLRLLARFCGDMALTFGATGGVFLAGGVLPRLRSILDAAAFRASFEHNSTYQSLLVRMPTALITASEPAFIGLAALARAPDRYVLDYRSRLWSEP